MNKTKFMQTDSKWGGLGYPSAPCYLRNCGCGEVSICNCIIEMEQFKNYTPRTIQPYCKQYAASNCDGTYFSGIPKMMEHYDMTEVMEHSTMSSLWKELEKGDRVAIYLMGSRLGGSKQVRWTSGGHFVCSVAYRVRNGLHEVYVKDSYSNSSLRNGWIGYETHMRNDVVKVWSGKLNSKVKKVEKNYEPTTPYKGKLPKGVVQKGDESDDVIRLKEFLNWCIGTHFKCNNKCGNGTIEALKKWQKKYGIVTDGVWGALCKKKAQEIIKKYAPKEEKKKTTKKKSKYYSTKTLIGQATANENGKLQNGKAGDQKGGELSMTKWYDGGWKYMFRAKDEKLRDRLAQAMIDACENDHIGYDINKPDRYTAYDLAEKNGHDIKGISKNCESTCSQLISMCMRAVGIPKKYAPRHMDILTMTKVMKGSPYFEMFTSKEYTGSPDKLMPGDILLSSHHTIMVIKSPNAK